MKMRMGATHLLTKTLPKVAAEMARSYGVGARVTCLPGDMFSDPVPTADVVLLSNVLHDWDVPQCRALIGHCAAVLPAGGRLVIHDVFLNDALDGPLPIALYSAALFCLTEGRAYSAAEMRYWLAAAGLNAAEVDRLLERIRMLRRDGITLCIVEHNMDLVMRVADHILVIDYGQYLFEGTPAEVQSHEGVIAAYLGGSKR